MKSKGNDQEPVSVETSSRELSVGARKQDISREFILRATHSKTSVDKRFVL